MKLLCLDYGEKRTGIAVSDPEGHMVFPKGMLLKKKRESFFAELLRIIAEERAEGLVVGLPLSADGGESISSRRARNFARSLQRRSALPVFFMDEAFSSFEAEAMLRTSGQKPHIRDGRVDSLAAARILEDFLRRGQVADVVRHDGRAAAHREAL